MRWRGVGVMPKWGKNETGVRPGGVGCEPNRGRQDSEANSRRSAASRIEANTGRLFSPAHHVPANGPRPNGSKPKPGD